MAVIADDVFEWLGVTTPEDTTLMERVLDAVSANIARHHTAPDPVTDDWDQAIIMQTARLWKRKSSPEGVISSDELGAIRVTRLDNDVATLLEPFRNVGFA